MRRRQQNAGRPAAEPVAAAQTSRSRRSAMAATPPVKVSRSRTMVVGLGSIISVVAVMFLLLAWGVGMTFLLLFGDRVSERIIAENSQMQDAYEQRLQAFRAEIARLTFEVEQSKFDTTSVEGRVVDLGRRQRQLEVRLLALKQLSDIVGGTAAGPPTLTPAPSRISYDEKEDVPFLIPIQADAPPVIQQAPQPRGESGPDIDGFILRMDRALRQTEQVQFAVLENFSRSSGVRIERIRSALTLVGLSPDQAMQMQGRQNLVIPKIVLPLSEQNTPFAQALERARQNQGLTLSVKSVVEALPTTRPTPASIRYSSGFGYRIHPLLGTRKLHAGVDMAAPQGTPVFASGSGVVRSAAWGGGYGNLIQIDHGNGLLSRYAHLSHVNVTTGQPVSIGTLIGLMGTTGTSTGSHLHFETRIHGTPVNPACFLLAGDKIGGVQTVPLPCEQPPNWQRKADEDEDDDN